MKLAPDIIGRKSIDSCICGKSSDKITVNVRLVKRTVSGLISAAAVIVLLILVYGTDKTIPYVWWTFVIYGIVFVGIAFFAARRMTGGHKLMCALRSATISVF